MGDVPGLLIVCAPIERVAQSVQEFALQGEDMIGFAFDIGAAEGLPAGDVDDPCGQPDLCSLGRRRGLLGLKDDVGNFLIASFAYCTQ